jgi:hypothetical protein
MTGRVRIRIDRGDAAYRIRERHLTGTLGAQGDLWDLRAARRRVSHSQQGQIVSLLAQLAQKLLELLSPLRDTRLAGR